MGRGNRKNKHSDGRKRLLLVFLLASLHWFYIENITLNTIKLNNAKNCLLKIHTKRSAVNLRYSVIFIFSVGLTAYLIM